jgi:hypothetical protein
MKSNGVELKAERRKPSGEQHCDIEDIPSLTGVLAHFRLHEFNAIRHEADGAPSYVELSLPGRTVVGHREFIRRIELCDPYQ